MKDIILNLFGGYAPIETTLNYSYSTVLDNIETIYSSFQIVNLINWEWVLNFGLFAFGLFMLFALLLSLMKRF